MANIAEKYNNAFSGLPVTTPFIANSSDVHSWHLYVLQLNIDELIIDRDEFIRIMADKGIGTSVHYIPLHLQPYWRQEYALKSDDFPKSSNAFERIVNI